MHHILLLFFVLFMTSCGGSDTPSLPLSSGLKIFATSSFHVGDFANDPLLSGANAIEKADTFCNKDAKKPNDSHYKAILVDGVLRDAPSLIDWVFKPNTSYYRSYGDIEIGTTSDSAIFPVLFDDLTNSIDIRRASDADFRAALDYAWSGIADATDYNAVGAANCSNWTTSDGQGMYALTYEKTSMAISAGASVYCSAKLRLYCVEQ